MVGRASVQTDQGRLSATTWMNRKFDYVGTCKSVNSRESDVLVRFLVRANSIRFNRD